MTTNVKEEKSLQAEEVKKSTPLFDSDINYKEKSDDRPYVFMVGKIPLFVNKEQYVFLREDYWKEYHEKWELSRCLVPAKRGVLKICRNDCSKCSYFLNGNIKSTYVNFSDWDEEDYLKQNHQASISDSLIKQEEIELMYKAIENLTDPIDKIVIHEFLLGTSDGEVAKKIGKSRTSVITCRKRCVKKMKEFLKI